MKIQVSGQNIQTGDALQTKVREKIESISEKYDVRATTATVVFVKTHGTIECKISAHAPSEDFTCHGSHNLAPEAFDAAAEKLEKHWRRHMRRIKENRTERNKEAHLD